MANISKITLPNGSTYDIYDAAAVHVGDITALMDLKGTKSSFEALPSSNNEVGDVWLISNTGEEYVWDGETWIKLGYTIEAASTTHTHNITVTGTNTASEVSGTVTVPKVTVGSKYISVDAVQGDVDASTDSVLGAGTTFTTTVTPATTNIKATASDVAVGANGTASAITGLGNPATEAVLGVDTTFSVKGGDAEISKMVTTTIKNPTVNNVNIPNVTGNTDVTASKVAVTSGSPANWSASVSEDGVLSFSWTANNPTAVTATEVTASKVTLGDAIPVSNVTTSDVTVATGSLDAQGAGAEVAVAINPISVAVDNADEIAAVTGYTNLSTSTVLTGVKVTAQPTIILAANADEGEGVVSVATGISSAVTTIETSDEVKAVTNITVGAPTITLSTGSINETGAVAVDVVTVDSETASVSGIAAAQVWTMDSGATGAPNDSDNT